MHEKLIQAKEGTINGICSTNTDMVNRVVDANTKRLRDLASAHRINPGEIAKQVKGK